MGRSGRVGAACAAILAVCAAAQTNSWTDRLTANSLKADVAFLASDSLQGRATPSPGLDAAAEFVASQFRRAGLEPVGDDGYFQTAPFEMATPVVEGLELTIEIAGQTLHADSNSAALQESAALDLKGAAAIKLPLGDQPALDALTVEQARGKVLVADLSDGGGGRGAFARARALPALAARLQAALVVVLLPNGLGANTNPRLREARAAVPVLGVWHEAIRAALASAKPGPLAAAVSAHIAAPATTPVKLRNVVGVLRGSDPAFQDTYVLLTAHYDHVGVRGTGPGDHVYNGANDDASGTASVIEIAGVLAGLPARPRRTIVFIALFGEEMGLLGSRYYAQHPIFPLARTVADLNLEQVGRTDVDNGARVGILNVTGYDFTNITDELKKAGQETDIRVMKDEQNSDPYYARSDNQAFADAGVPSHTLSVGYMFPDYHGAGDEWPKLDYENMAKIDRTVAIALWRIAGAADAPHWNPSPKTERYRKARGAGL